MKPRHGITRLFASCFALSAAIAQQPAAPGDPPSPLTPAEQKAADMRMPQLDRSALTPDARKNYPMVSESEKNPFTGSATKVTDQMMPAEPVTEEKKIRRVLANLRVSGISQSSSGPRVVLGSLPLGEGDELPKLFAGQSERLKVKSITERDVVLVFVEPETSRKERSIGVRFDLDAQTNSISLLVGEAFLKVVPLDKDGAALLPVLTNVSAENFLKVAEGQDLRSLVERRTELFDAPAELAPPPDPPDEGKPR